MAGFRSFLAFWLGGASAVEFILTPAYIDVLEVPGEDRTLTLASESRSLSIESENRTLTVPFA